MMRSVLQSSEIWSQSGPDDALLSRAMMHKSAPGMSLNALLLFTLWIHLASCVQLPFILPTEKSPTEQLVAPEVEAYIHNVLSRHSSPGLAVAVVLKDPSTTTGFRHQLLSFGHAHTSPSPVPVTPDTLFAIASNSKLFLALSTGLLISNGSLNLEWTTKVASVIPEWKLMDPIASKEATLLDLLVHRTGMPRHDFAGAALDGGVPAMIANLRHLRPSAPFRSTFQYNNMMFETLSHLPMRLLNVSFESYVAQHIFQPAGMNSSTYSVEDAEARRYPPGYKFPGGMEGQAIPVFAQGHQYSSSDFYAEERGTLRPTVPYFVRPGEERIWAGAGGVLTSVRDMVPWLSTLLNGGVVPHTNKTLIPPAVLARLETGVSVSNGKAQFPELSPRVYGPAQWRYSYRGHEIIEHGGNNPGFKTQVARFPDLDGKISRFPNATGLGIAVFSNDAAGGVVHESVKWRIADALLGLEEIDWYSRYVKEEDEYYAKKRRAALPRPEKPQPPPQLIPSLQNYTFSHPAYGVLRPCYVPPGAPGLRTNISTSPQTLSHYTEMDHDRAAACDSFLQHPTTRLLLAHTPVQDIPTLVVPFRHTFATHLRLTHWSGPWFNVSVIWGNQGQQKAQGIAGGEDGDSDGILIGLDERFEVEWVAGRDGEEDGLAFRGGIWGMEGPDAKAPEGTGKEGAEIWFARV
ncbi:beta-lactamase/transpeptidase-like protein [Lyophyllum atratum]|nr:beta-lactamase/transpeptidase-like protein [Lyophyllum atratum]